MNSIGNNIRLVREMRGYSQDYMASQLEMSQTHYSRLESERSKITVELLEKIAMVLDVDASIFLKSADNFIQHNHNHSQTVGSASVIHFQSEITKEYFDAQLQAIKDLYEARIKELKELYESQLKEYQRLIERYKPLS